MNRQIPERVEVRTEDDVLIVGDWYVPERRSGWCTLLLHMMPADRSSWSEFSLALAQNGWSSLAIDLRGHGESTRAGDVILDYRTFSEKEHQHCQKDVTSALAWLSQQGFSSERTVIIGASIGANLALAAAAKNNGLPGIITLSPGFRYGGIDARACTVLLTEHQSVLFVASNDDPESAEAVQTLATETKAKQQVLMLNSAGHGTTMFVQEPSLNDQLQRWLGVLRESKGGVFK